MSIAYVNSAGFGRASTTITGNYTIKPGENRIIVFACACFTGNDVTNVTYAGIALTLAGRIPGDASGSQGGATRSDSLWYLLNPPIGTAVCSATGTSGQFMHLLVANYTGVAGVRAGAGLVFTPGATGATSSVCAPTAADAMAWSVGALTVNNGPTITAGARTITRQLGPFNENAMFDSNGNVGAGIPIITVNTSTSQKQSLVTIAMIPVPRRQFGMQRRPSAVVR